MTNIRRIPKQISRRGGVRAGAGRPRTRPIKTRACHSCGTTTLPKGRWYCDTCREQKTIRLCPCGKNTPAPGKHYCSECKKLIDELRRKRPRSGKHKARPCIRCGEMHQRGDRLVHCSKECRKLHLKEKREFKANLMATEPEVRVA